MYSIFLTAPKSLLVTRNGLLWTQWTLLEQTLQAGLRLPSIRQTAGPGQTPGPNRKAGPTGMEVIVEQKEKSVWDVKINSLAKNIPLYNIYN